MIVPVSLLIGSVSLDLLACYCVKRSKGFQKVVWGVAGLLAIISAFVLLSFVVRHIRWVLPIQFGVVWVCWGQYCWIACCLTHA